MSRWILIDPVGEETWVMPINPDSMSRTAKVRNLTFTAGTAAGDQRVRTFQGAPTSREWEWAGVIRTQAHYEALEHWAQKRNAVEVTDHLGLRWRIYITAFDPTDRRPTPRTPWRLRYSMTTTILEGPL